jgi:hypothetical protein
LTWVELTGSGNVAIDAFNAAVMSSMTSGEKTAFEKSFIAVNSSAHLQRRMQRRVPFG